VKLLVAGWKSVSLVDVQGHPVFTLWLCGCNLKCPFCHNWRLAERDPNICKYADVSTIVEEAEASKALVDYFHVTGGEPLIQYSALEHLLKEVRKIGLLTSLNSNLTIYRLLERLVEQNLIDHVATDLKIPPEELYGLPIEVSKKLWIEFLKSLALLKRYGIPLELRIPLHKDLTLDVFASYFKHVEEYLDRGRTVIILNQLIGKPLTTPRSPEWVNVRSKVSDEQIRQLASILKTYGFSKIYVRSIQGF